MKNRIRGVLAERPNLLWEEWLERPFFTRRPTQQGVRHVRPSASDTPGRRLGGFAMSVQALCQSAESKLGVDDLKRPSRGKCLDGAGGFAAEEEECLYPVRRGRGFAQKSKS